MRRATLVLLVLFAFAVPWEYSLDLGEPLGNVARIVGLLTLVCAIPAAMRMRDTSGENGRRGIRQPGTLQWMVLAFYLYFVLSYFWTVDQAMTLDKIRGYVQEMMVVWLVWEFAETAEDLRWLLRAFVAGCWVLALLTIQEFTSVSAIAAQQIRFVAEGQDPNDVARFLDLAFPFATLLFVTEKRWPLRLLAVGYLPAGLLAVVLTASRGGFMAAVAAMAGAAVLVVTWRPKAGIAMLAGLGACGGGIALLVPEGALERLSTIPEQLGSSDLNDRVNIWTSGGHAFTQAPWFGYGAGAFTAAARLAPFDTAHNTVLAVLVMGGLMGASLLLAICIAALWAALRPRGLLRVSLLTTLTVLGVASTVGSVEENRATWLIFAVCALAGRLAQEDPGELERGFGVRQRQPPETRAHAVS